MLLHTIKMPHTATLKIFGENGTTILTNESLTIKDTVLDQTSISVGSLSLSSDAAEGILFSQGGEKVMAVGVTEHVSYGDETLVHWIESFECVDAASAAIVCAAFQPEAPAYGLLRFTLWQGTNPTIDDNIAFCIRTFANARAAENASLAFPLLVAPGGFDPVLMLIQHINFFVVAQPADAVSLKATYDAITPALLATKNITAEGHFYSCLPGYTKVNTKAPLSTVGQDDKVIVSERAKCSTAHGAVAVASAISAQARGAYGTAGSPLEWQVGVYGNDVWCLRVFSVLDDYLAALVPESIAPFFAMFTSLTGIDVFVHLPGDSADGKASVEATGYVAAFAAINKELNMMYLKETIEDPISGQQPKHLP